MAELRISKKEDKIKELGNKICRWWDYHEHKKGRFWEGVALIDVLFAICRILRSHDERLKELEKHNEFLLCNKNLNLKHHEKFNIILELRKYSRIFHK